MSLAAAVAERLEEEAVPFAVIGAAAMAVHGVLRSTRDLDLLTIDPGVLGSEIWAPLAAGGVAVEIRRGDGSDPLAGVVRLSRPGEAPVDLIVGRAAWQRAAIESAARSAVSGSALPVVRLPDLVLLKLFAGGPQDAWDIEELLSTGDRRTLIGQVTAGVGRLPEAARRLWRRLTEPGG